MNICPNCSVLLPKTTQVNGPPTTGSVTVCFNCVSVNIFNEEMRLRIMMPEELSQMKREAPESYSLVQQAVNYINSRKIRMN